MCGDESSCLSELCSRCTSSTMVSACRAQLLKFWSKVMLYGSVTAFVLFSLVAFFWIFRCAVAVCIVVSRVVVRLSERWLVESVIPACVLVARGCFSFRTFHSDFSHGAHADG